MRSWVDEVEEACGVDGTVVGVVVEEGVGLKVLCVSGAEVEYPSFGVGKVVA